MRCCLKVFSLEWKLSSPYLKYIFVLIRKGRILGIVNTTVSITWQDFEGGKLRNSVSTGWETPVWNLQIALTAKSLTLKFNERSEAFSIQFPRSLTSQIGECELVHSFKSTNLYGSLWFVVVRTYHPNRRINPDKWPLGRKRGSLRLHVTGFHLDSIPLSSRTEGKSKWLLGPSQYTAWKNNLKLCAIWRFLAEMN